MKSGKRSALLIIASFLIALVTVNPAYAAPSILNVDLDTPNPKIGDVINWLVEADCSGLPIQQVMMYVRDPSGVNGWLTNSYKDIKSGSLGTKATIKIPFKITSEAAAGTYAVQSVSMTCQNKSGGEYTWSGSLEKISFELKKGSDSPATTQPKFEKVELKSPAEIKVGEKILINVSAVGTGKLNSAEIKLRGPNGVEVSKYFDQYSQKLSGDAAKRLETTFTYEVDEDWVGGSYKISSLTVQGTAGTDPYNPEADDPNPRNSTSSFARNVTLQLATNGTQSASGQPYSGSVTQPSLSDIAINVVNSNPIQIAPPIVTNLALPTEAVSAGTPFEMTISMDGKNAYIYNLSISFSEKDSLSKSFYCNSPILQKGPYQKVWNSLVVKCDTQRTNPAGVYVLRSININSTSCNVTPGTLYEQANASCTQPPRSRSSNYNYQIGYGFTSSSPTMTPQITNVLDGTQQVTLLDPAPLQAPKYTSVVVESTQIKISYPWTYDLTCDYSASSGSVTSGTNDKISNVVTISGLKPATKVVLSGTCTAQDKAKVSFVETFTTKLPAPPVLPSVLSKKVDLDSITVVLSDANQEGVDYEVDSTKGSVVIAGDSLEITDLEPGESTVVTMTMTDAYGQSTSGIIGTFVTEAPPKLEAPVVKLLSKKKSSYNFQFNKLKSVTYTSRGVNCQVKITGDNISVTNLVPGKIASAFITAADDYGQKMTTKFLSAKIVAR